MKKIFDFKEQLAKGNAGEELFLSKHPDLTRLDGKHGDFVGFSGKKIELKTDSRTVKDSPNFFMERFRNEKQENGGPFQAADNQVHYFVYLFSCGTIYWFETAALVLHLNEHELDYKKHSVQNKGWAAIGWLVPRASLEALIVKKENINERHQS